MLSEPPTTQAPGFVEIRRVFSAGESVDVTFPGAARATYPDARIDAIRGTFAVEQGPLVLALESPDLPPGWNVNEITADPESIDVKPGRLRHHRCPPPRTPAREGVALRGRAGRAGR